MKFIKSKIIFLVGTCLLGCAIIANAEDLKVSNNSKYDFSFSINNACSRDLGVVGSRTIKIIPEENLNQACAYNLNHCEIMMYKNASCKGKSIVKIVLDTKLGMQSVRTSSKGVSAGVSMFNLFLTGPWQ